MSTLARPDVPSGLGFPDFSVAQHREGSAGLVTVSGEVDVETAPRLRKAILAVLEEGGQDLVVDLRSVSFLDSTALGVLVAGLKRAREAGGDLQLVATGTHILRMLAITRLDAVFNVYPDLESAVSPA
jgi:anti-sigma B factor antagonist